MLSQRTNEILEKSFLKDLLRNENITDIRFNGTKLWLQYNDRPYGIAEKQPKEADVRRLVRQIEGVQGKEFTNSEPILDTEMGFLRVNAVHDAVSPDGTTLSIRVSRPRLALRNVQELVSNHPVRKIADFEKINKEVINQNPVEHLLEVLMKAGSNVLISGQTGAGKTELQKLLVGFIPNDKKINLLEDTRDSHIKALYPEKDIMSWQTLLSDDRAKKVTMQDLVKASLRNNPDWVIISETRGVEASDMLDSAKTDHSIISTVHAKGATNIPSRLIPMIKQSPSYQTIDEKIIGKEIVEFLRFGIHLELEFVNNQAVRKIKEIVEYTDYTSSGVEARHLYRYQEKFDPTTNQYFPYEEMNPLSDETLTMLQDKKLFHLLPDVFVKSSKLSDSSGGTVIPSRTPVSTI